MSERSSLLLAVLILDLGLGGGAAISMGRALARAWRPFSVVYAYAIMLSAGIGFLHFAIFGLSTIPLTDISAAVSSLAHSPLLSLGLLAHDLIGWAEIAALVSGFAWIGYRRMRRTQMIERYDWLFEPRGFFRWRRRSSSK